MKDIKILLVDDEQGFVETLSERLKLRDLCSETAYDGEEALRFVDSKEPDVLILDLKMPGMNGLEVLRRIKTKFPHIQVIMLTGHGSDIDEAEARNLGAFDYLTKPVDMNTLVSRIKAAYLAMPQHQMA